MAHKSLGRGLDGILVVAKPPGPTSHDVVALVRRLAAPSGWGMAGRWTRSPRASCRSSSATGRGSWSTTRATARATARPSASGPSSSTDDLEGELAPSRGPAPTRDAVEAALDRLHGADLAAAARVQRDQGRRPAGLCDGPGRRDGRPRRARGHHPRADDAEWDGRTPDRPIAIWTSCSAGDVRPRDRPGPRRDLGSAAYLGALVRGLGAVRARGCRPARRGARGGRRRCRRASSRCSVRSTRAWTPSRTSR